MKNKIITARITEDQKRLIEKHGGVSKLINMLLQELHQKEIDELEKLNKKD